METVVTDVTSMNVVVSVVNIVMFTILIKVARGHHKYFKTKDHPNPEKRHKHHNLVATLAGRPFWKKITSKHSRKHMIGIAVGVAVMLLGSTMAVSHHYFHQIPANLWDGFAYFLHGAGAIPLMRHIEPLWLLFAAE